jgi:hypothetical protein
MAGGRGGSGARPHRGLALADEVVQHELAALRLARPRLPADQYRLVLALARELRVRELGHRPLPEPKTTVLGR